MIIDFFKRQAPVLTALVFVAAAVPAQALTAEGRTADNKTIELDVPFVPTPPEVVDVMLKLADVKRGDLVYDLGSGDGRIVVAAAKKFGARGVGVDLDPVRIKEAKENVKNNKVGHLVEIRQGNALKTDVSKADVVTLYLLPSVNMDLRPKLQKLPAGTRIVSHDFDMGDWKPLKTVEVHPEGGGRHTVYLWKVGKK